MREGSPSITAMFVAFARAVGSDEPELSRACQDPFADRVVPRPWSTLLHAARRAPKPAQRFRELRWLSFGLIDHLALRTGLIDRALKRAISEGIKQVVLLGAGLDTRAHRIGELRDVTFFEVDHPSTQGLKTRKAAGLPIAARELRYAACDFARVSLDEALSAEGFAPREPSIWIWEGVTMYLDESAVDESLAHIAALSAPGSVLIATYLSPKTIANGSLLGQFGLVTLAAISEPVRMQRTPKEMADKLAAKGFEVEFDALPADVSSEFGVPRPLRGFGMPDEHVLIAHKKNR